MLLIINGQKQEHADGITLGALSVGGRMKDRAPFEQMLMQGHHISPCYEYRGRRADPKRRAQVVALRRSGHSITRTAELAGCSPSQVKRIWAEEVSQAEARRRGAFTEDALTEADALAAADQEGAKA